MGEVRKLMGEISEMVLEGTLCEQCGQFALSHEEEEPPGHPQLCDECKAEET